MCLIRENYFYLLKFSYFYILYNDDTNFTIKMITYVFLKHASADIEVKTRMVTSLQDSLYNND